MNQHFELFFYEPQRPCSHRLAFQAIKGNELGVGPIVLGTPIMGSAKKLHLCCVERADSQGGAVKCRHQSPAVNPSGFHGEVICLSLNPRAFSPSRSSLKPAWLLANCPRHRQTFLSLSRQKSKVSFAISFPRA